MTQYNMSNTSPTIGKVVCWPSIEPLGVEDRVIAQIQNRRDSGRKKYGTTMERDDLSTAQWLRHAQEEALDLAIYLEKLKRVEDAKLPTTKDVQDIYELSRLNAELESAKTQLDDAYKAIGLSNFSSEPLSCYLQRYLDALKKAKCALDDIKAHEHVSPVLSYPCLFVLDDALTAINALNL